MKSSQIKIKQIWEDYRIPICIAGMIIFGWLAWNTGTLQGVIKTIKYWT